MDVILIKNRVENSAYISYVKNLNKKCHQSIRIEPKKAKTERSEIF